MSNEKKVNPSIVPELEPAKAIHTIEQRQRDIEFGNEFRLEYIKHLLSISTGVFVFTVTFMKELLGPSSIHAAHAKFVLVAGWLLLIVSIVAGIFHMRFWTWFFISWGRSPEDLGEVAWREKVMRLRRIAEIAQVYMFLAGLLAIVVFAILNIYHGH